MARYTPFHVTVTNVTGTLYEGEVTLLSVPSVEGTAVVLAHHEPLIALLRKGNVLVEDGVGKVTEFAIESGVLEVGNNRAIVLV